MTIFAKPAGIISGNTITRPADTTAYASGDLVANSTTAGSVTPFTFPAVVRQPGYKAIIKRAGLFMSQALVTNGSFRLHLFSALPTVTNGDNGALDVATNLAAHIGSFDITLVALGTGQGATGWGAPTVSNAEVGWSAGNSVALFGLLEARAAYVPANAQTIKALLDVAQY